MAASRENVPETDIASGDLIVGHWDAPARVVNRSTAVTPSGRQPFLVRLATDAGVMEVSPGSFITRIIED
jgi:hypothetical protein